MSVHIKEVQVRADEEQSDTRPPHTDRGAAMEVTKRQQMIRSPLNCNLDQSAAPCCSALFDIVIRVDGVKGRKTARALSETGDVSPGFMRSCEEEPLQTAN